MSERVVTKDGLMSHIERDWNALISWLKTLTPNQLSEIRNAEGWALKDHVAHMATWENYALFFIQRQPGHEGLGIPQEVYLREDLDEMNALIFQKHKDVPYDVSWQRFMSIHTQLLDLLAPLTTEDLMQPYVYYLPDEPGGGDGPPALNVVYGNTAHHYRLHQGWMEAMLREAQ